MRSIREPVECGVVRAPYAVRAAAALGVLAVTGAVARRGLPEWERSGFRAVYSLPDPLERALWAPMQAGSAWAPVAVGAASGLAWRRWRPAAGAAGIGLATWSVAKVVKAGIKRGRPAALIDGLALRTGAPRDGLGFVSGHTAVATCLATILSPYLSRRARTAAFGLAAIVGGARIHVGAHLPLDTVGGAALGAALGWAWNGAVGAPG